VLPSRSLSQIRSFAEHRAADVQDERTAIVENSPVLGLLFLNNNLHVVHHDKPALPWYRIPAYYQANRARIIEANGGLVYDGYGDVIRRYFLTPHHEGAHPGHDAPRVSVPSPARRLAHAAVLSQAIVEYPAAAASSSKAATAA
jgi:fatty acid desaturase